MIECAETIRDKALIAVLYEGGFRIEELLNRRLGDVIFDANGAKVRVNGKTGPRIVRLITSVSLLARWIEQHPFRGKNRYALWASFSRESKGQQLEYHCKPILLKSAATCAGVGERIYPHLFKHSAATRDAHFLTEAQLRIKFGWSRFSTMSALYVHLAAVMWIRR